jgi:VCBS repeat-containing protein
MRTDSLSRLEQYGNVTIAANGSWMNDEDHGSSEDDS